MAYLSKLTPEPDEKREVRAALQGGGEAVWLHNLDRWLWAKGHVLEGENLPCSNATMSDRWELVEPAPEVAPEVERWALVQNDGQVYATNPENDCWHPVAELPFVRDHTFLGIEAVLPDGGVWPRGFWLWWDDTREVWCDASILKIDDVGDWHAITPLTSGPAFALMRRKGGG